MAHQRRICLPRSPTSHGSWTPKAEQKDRLKDSRAARSRGSFIIGYDIPVGVCAERPRLQAPKHRVESERGKATTTTTQLVKLPYRASRYASRNGDVQKRRAELSPSLMFPTRVAETLCAFSSLYSHRVWVDELLEYLVSRVSSSLRSSAVVALTADVSNSSCGRLGLAYGTVPYRIWARPGGVRPHPLVSHPQAWRVRLAGTRYDTSTVARRQYCTVRFCSSKSCNTVRYVYGTRKS